MDPLLVFISVFSILFIFSRFVFLAFFKNLSECFLVISDVSTDESSLSHNQLAKIFCMCLTRIRDYLYQTNIHKFTPSDTGAQNSVPSPRGTFLSPKQSFNIQIEM